MNKHAFELAASISGFLGGAILSLDALFALRHVRQERGKEITQQAARESSGTYVDDKNRPLNSAYKLQLWFAGRSVLSARIGFGLVTLGFLFDIIGKFC